ncbi:hypothetical protein N7468_008156 [Penicillium chermesinum]|uniref:Uncharacterized protein n=1 Tax=Penicillium chermesinum TaxID=63820 RepID=A0A9W9NS52_9EURO|nr:uncharacterized protein N7468_008156 [Penicillium chermesinum]KAJ5223614.1 hypothetical protein N7468_008156 [Penicillium chermesinum]
MGDIISNRIFAVADERTLADDTVILAQRSESGLHVVRLAPIQSNVDAISVEVGVMTVRELIFIEAGRG